MNERGKCTKLGCPAFGVEKSIPLLRHRGFAAPNDRAFCPLCQELMRTTRTRAQNIKGSAGLKTPPTRIGKSPSSSKKKLTFKLKVSSGALGTKAHVKKLAKKSGVRKISLTKRG